MLRSFWERLRGRVDRYDDEEDTPEPPEDNDVLTVQIRRDFYEQMQRANDIVRTIDRHEGAGWCAQLAAGLRERGG
jgi:hypothetical protein